MSHQMKKFLAVFTGTEAATEKSGWNALSDTERDTRTQDGIKAWHAWMTTHKDRVAAMGGPLGKTLKVASDGISPTKNNLCGYVLVTADSHADAAKLFEGHPHFSIFPGEAVEVLECLPLPGP
ncbi:MAG: hypothetical protein MUC43_14780 [Pirellula sp.]|nr:hypothetical protein [Pirellula sp.]